MAKTSSVVADEVRQFASHAGDWWDPDGSQGMLHKLNPVRLSYIRDRINQHWDCDERSFRPLEGKTALDVGCGAGLLTEPLARLGAQVTGIDVAPELIDAAHDHASKLGLQIDYRATALEALDGRFDIITAMEVIEHVAEPQSFLASLAARLSPGGLLILSTPNRTALSKLATIDIAEGLGRIPKGTHDFDKFIDPERMKVLLSDAGLKSVDIEGIAWSPLSGLHRSDDLRLNYLLAAVPATS
jgi:2-polyprenyl-6-hydroxyphenyl methylase/3-demethylubiquinone-9 3-methyltransferase